MKIKREDFERALGKWGSAQDFLAELGIEIEDEPEVAWEVMGYRLLSDGTWQENDADRWVAPTRVTFENGEKFLRDAAKALAADQEVERLREMAARATILLRAAASRARGSSDPNMADSARLIDVAMEKLR